MIDDVRRRLAAAGTLLCCVTDEDVNVSAISFRSEATDLDGALAALLERIGAPVSVGRAFRFDLQTGANALSDEAVRRVAVAVHGALRGPVYIARRTVPASEWKAVRAMGWGHDGLAPPQNAPVLPYSGSESLGIAIEVGPPLYLLKVQFAGCAEAAAQKIVSAVGGPGSGFAEVAAYLVAAVRDHRCIALFELSDLKRTPAARVLRVLEIEAWRYGVALAAGAFLSHIPLQTLLDTLALHTGLSAQPAQIIETHLRAAMPNAS